MRGNEKNALAFGNKTTVIFTAKNQQLQNFYKNTSRGTKIKKNGGTI